MSFQIPKPTNIPVHGKGPAIPGKNFKPPGIHTGARPGVPKPKNPALINGKPMVPIQNLIQFTPKFDPETEDKSPNDLNAQRSESQEVKLNGESTDLVNEPIIQDDQLGSKIDNKVNNIEGGAEQKEKISFGNGIESSDPEMEGISKVRNQVSPLTIETKSLERKSQELLSSKKGGNGDSEVTEIQLNGKSSEKLESRGGEIDPEGSPKTGNQGPKAEVFEVGVNDGQQKQSPFGLELGGRKERAKVDENNTKKSPFGVLKTPEIKTNQFSGTAEKKIEKDDEDQNQSPATRDQEGRSTQDEPRDYGIHDDPSSGLSNETKRKDYLEEEISDNLGSIKKGYHFQREEENSLLNQVKALRLELEREQQEKSLMKSENERILKENIDLRSKLDLANKKCETLEKKESSSRELARKDQEIKKLKSELRSTMEGSRLLTEHTNRVISESTKFKEETENLISKLEREKDELHQRFLEYKKESQQDYIAKFTALQEKITYLQNKIQEYESEMERSQIELRQKISRMHKLAQINEDVKSTISYWPTFTPKTIIQYQVASKDTLEEVPTRDQELVMVEESPAMNPLNAEEVVENLGKAEEFEVDVDVGVRTEIENVPEEVNEEVQPENEWNLDVQVDPEELVQETVEINQGGWGDDQDLQIEEELQVEERQEEQAVEEVQENNLVDIVDQHPWGYEEPVIPEIEVRENEPEANPEEEVVRQEEVWGIEEPVIEERVQEDPEEGLHIETQEQKYEEPPVQVETTQEEKVEEPPVMFYPGKAHIAENNVTIDAMSAPPSNRLLHKKKKGGPVQKHVPWMPMAMPTVTQTVEEELPVQTEEPVQNGTTDLQQEEVHTKPPVKNFVGGHQAFKKPNIPHFNKPFVNRPPVNGKQVEENHTLDLAQEEQTIPVVDVENTNDYKGNGELEQSLEQTENSSRKMSLDTRSQEDLDDNQNKPVGNGAIKGKPVKISKAIKRKEPINGSIYS